jgi:hypothetical protein
MNKLIYAGMFIGSWIGWKIGYAGEDMMIALIVSTLFSGLGVYAGWLIGRRLQS